MVLVVDFKSWKERIIPKIGDLDCRSNDVTQPSQTTEMKNVHDPIEFATRLLKMPQAKAMQFLDVTPPTSVEAFAAIWRLQDPDNPLVDVYRMMYAIEEYELTFLRESRTNPPSGGAFVGWSAPLINVWENYDSFMLQPETRDICDIGKLCFGSTPTFSPNTHSVVDRETFITNFEVFTAGQFKGWTDWDNMVVIGGSMVASLMPVPAYYDAAKYYHEDAYPSSDIDVYFYGLSDEDFAKKVNRLYEHLRKVNEDILVLRTKYTVTFCSQYPKRHIQVVIGKWNNIAEIVFEPDIDCTCVVYDGKDVWATQRSRFSFNHRCIITSTTRYLARGCPEYESRLIKYSKRGFSIH